MSNCIHILNNLALRDKYCHYSHHPYFAWGNQGTEDVATAQGLTLVRSKTELDHTDLVPETQRISDFLMTRLPGGAPTAVPEFLLLPQVLVIQSCLTLCDPMDCSLPGSSIHGILWARILAWVTMPSSRGSSRPRDQTWIFCIAGTFFTIWATREAPITPQFKKEGERDKLGVQD